MLVAVPLLGALGAMPLLGSIDTRANALVAAEVAAGHAPPRPGEEAEPVLTAQLLPRLALQLTTPRLESEISAGSRLFHRTPNLVGVERPLVLWLANAGATYAIDPRLSWVTSAGLRYGESDYTNAAIALDSDVASELDEPVVSVLGLDVQTGLAWLASERLELGVTVFADRSQRLSTEASATLPDTTSAGAQLSQTWRLDARSSLIVPLNSRYYWVSPGRDVWTGTLRTDYQRELSRRVTWTVGAGATLAKSVGDAEADEDEDAAELGDEDDDEAPDTQLIPEAVIAIEQTVFEAQYARVSNRFAATLSATMDPTSGELNPIAGFDASGRANLGERWSTSLALGFRTAATEDPTREGAQDTNLGATATANYQLDTWCELHFGVRWAARGPHLSQEPFELEDEQIWGIVGLNAVIGVVRNEVARDPDE